MIRVDQPECFGSDVVVAVSSKSDGPMLNRERGVHHPDILANRKAFSEKAGISYDDVVYQKIVYGDNESYDLLKEVGTSDTVHFAPGVPADALVTRERGVGLFLPVADCVATVIYDPVHGYLALLHLGRHSTLTPLLEKTIRYFRECGSEVTDIVVWMSPSAKRDTYRLEWFDHENDPKWKQFYTRKDGGYFLDLPGYNRERCIENGIRPERIFISPVDTTRNPEYFSHRGGDKADRIAVLAMMR